MLNRRQLLRYFTASLAVGFGKATTPLIATPFCCTGGGQKIGFVPRVNNRALARLMDEGKTLSASISAIPAQRWSEPGINGNLDLG